MSVKNVMRYLLGTTLLVVILLIAPVLFFLRSIGIVISSFLAPEWFHLIDNFFWGLYQKTVIFYFKYVSGLEVTIEGSIPDKSENAVMICNHQTDMDWIIADYVALSQGMVGDMRFVFKDILKYFPIMGYLWAAHGGIFVTRDGSYNMKNMKNILQDLLRKNIPLYLVIFPEGTRFNPKKLSYLEKSRSYASNNGLEPLDEVLTPRAKAFHCAVTSMDKNLDAVYDITIVYEDEEDGKKRQAAPSTIAVLSGMCSRVHVKFERIPASEVDMQSVDSTFKWLYQRFKLKDNLLKKYYGDDSQKKNYSHLPLIPLPSNEVVLAGALSTLSLILVLNNSLGRYCYMLFSIFGTLFGYLCVFFYY